MFTMIGRLSIISTLGDPEKYTSEKHSPHKVCVSCKVCSVCQPPLQAHQITVCFCAGMCVPDHSNANCSDGSKSTITHTRIPSPCSAIPQLDSGLVAGGYQAGGCSMGLQCPCLCTGSAWPLVLDSSAKLGRKKIRFKL